MPMFVRPGKRWPFDFVTDILVIHASSAWCLRTTRACAPTTAYPEHALHVNWTHPCASMESPPASLVPLGTLLRKPLPDSIGIRSFQCRGSRRIRRTNMSCEAGQLSCAAASKALSTSTLRQSYRSRNYPLSDHIDDGCVQSGTLRCSFSFTTYRPYSTSFKSDLRAICAVKPETS